MLPPMLDLSLDAGAGPMAAGLRGFRLGRGIRAGRGVGDVFGKENGGAIVIGRVGYVLQGR